jgi:hypothetical protein
MTLVERNRPIVLGVYEQPKSGGGAQSPPAETSSSTASRPMRTAGTVGHRGKRLVTADGSSVSATLAANKV